MLRQALIAVRPNHEQPSTFLDERLFTDWLSPEILALWKRRSEDFRLQITIEPTVPKKGFKQMTKALEREERERP